MFFLGGGAFEVWIGARVVGDWVGVQDEEGVGACLVDDVDVVDEVDEVDDKSDLYLLQIRDTPT